MLRPGDIGHLFLFILALLPARVMRQQRRHLFLICESGAEARDNGYWLFKFLREERPEVDAVYAIKRGSREYEKVAKLGPTIEYGSFRHWIYYLAAEVNISSQKYGKPNAAVCYLMEVVLGWLRNTRVFLQHGVIKDDLPFLHYDKTKMSLFCCAAEREYVFVRDTFGYPSNVVQYVGLCRFDTLHKFEAEKNLLLIVPTWRMWLERNRRGNAREAFLQSQYYRCWNELLQSKSFATLLQRYGKRAVFCLHRNMESFETAFSTDNPDISILRWQEADVPELLKQAGVMVTDFSSVAMDFAYMKKPLVYYQFDLEAFRSGHLPVGYFDYERDGFGDVCSRQEEVLAALEEIFQSDCMMKETYKARVERFFTMRDDKNCERTYTAVKEMLTQSKKRVKQS